MYEDKIISGGEITQHGEFNGTHSTMYLFIAPKSEEASNIHVLSVKISQNNDYVDYPFVVGVWNPIVVNKVNVKQEDLNNYRIFWGETL